MQDEQDTLTVEVVIKAKDIERFDDLLETEHDLGSGQPVGHYLRQAVCCRGEWVALLAWGAACYALKLRDEWIGWTPTHRAERQKLVVQNRRFLMLGAQGAHPNRASQALARATKVLSQQWQEHFGYAPVLAETFTNLESYSGTCYKASGWEAVGKTKGYGRHRADFYREHQRPKKLWLKPLHSEAREMLCGCGLPEAQQAGGQSNAHGVLPLRLDQARSLFETLQTVPDPRASNSQFRLGSVLSIVAMAILSGYRNIMDFVSYGQRLKQPQRARLGLPYKKRGQRFRRVPSYGVYWEILSRIKPEDFAITLNRWLAAHRDQLPRCMAIDGKMIREMAGIVCLVDHQTGKPVALAPCSRKKGDGENCELKVSRKVLANLPDLSGTILTADALHCQDATAQIVMERGGDYFLQVKENQPTLFKLVQQATAHCPPFLPIRRKKSTDAWKPVAAI
jgi:hypothetical protein